MRDLLTMCVTNLITAATTIVIISMILTNTIVAKMTGIIRGQGAKVMKGREIVGMIRLSVSKTRLGLYK